MKLGKVVFLDIDGVLNSSRYFGDRKESDDGLIPNITAWQRMIDPEAVKVLNEILERSGAVVVLSSSWRCMLKVSEVQTALEARGFEGKIVDATPQRSPAPPYRRGNEIQAWLNDNQVDAFVILDDDGDMEHLMPKLVQTSPILGLGPGHVPHVLAQLGA